VVDLDRAAELVAELQELQRQEGLEPMRKGEADQLTRYMWRGHYLNQLEQVLGLPPYGLDGLPCEAVRLPMGRSAGKEQQ
jgi:hypothetical protein